MYTKWNSIHELFVKNNYDKLTDAQITEELKKLGLSTTVAAVRKKRQRLSLKKACGRLPETKVDI